MTQLQSQSKEDFQILLIEAMGVAEFLLKKNKEFYPFGVYLNANNEPVVIHVDDRPGTPSSQELIDELTVSLGRAKGLKAACIATMANLSDNPRQDVVSIYFEHKSGDLMNVTVPYDFKGFRKQLVMGDPDFSESTKRILNLFN